MIALLLQLAGLQESDLIRLAIWTFLILGILAFLVIIFRIGLTRRK